MRRSTTSHTPMFLHCHHWSAKLHPVNCTLVTECTQRYDATKEKSMLVGFKMYIMIWWLNRIEDFGRLKCWRVEDHRKVVVTSTKKLQYTVTKSLLFARASSSLTKTFPHCAHPEARGKQRFIDPHPRFRSSLWVIFVSNFFSQDYMTAKSRDFGVNVPPLWRLLLPKLIPSLLRTFRKDPSI